MSISRGASALVLTTSLTLVAACGGSGAEPTTIVEAAGDGFGSPAEPTDADRTVEVIVDDGLVFEPADFTVAAGETITFRIVNQGSLLHDFTLGDQATQDEHEAEMNEMPGMVHDQPNVVAIPAGDTAELTWTFPEAGTVLIGCHEPGHYAAGMKGQVTIEA